MNARMDGWRKERREHLDYQGPTKFVHLRYKMSFKLGMKKKSRAWNEPIVQSLRNTLLLVGIHFYLSHIDLFEYFLVSSSIALENPVFLAIAIRIISISWAKT